MKPMENKTAMKRLLAQLKDERANIPMDIEWDRCYQAIEMVIQNTYLPVEKKQTLEFVRNAVRKILDEDRQNPFNLEQYYNETYGSEGIDAKDVVLGYKTSLDAQMLDKIEPKQETLVERMVPLQLKYNLDMNKQERLEEAAEKYANELPEPHNYGINSDKKKGFIEGAKWQSERMYSEEEMKNAFKDGSWVTSWSDMGIEMKYDTFEQWFEQFKK
jgi:hypothetical protein